MAAMADVSGVAARSTPGFFDGIIEYPVDHRGEVGVEKPRFR